MSARFVKNNMYLGIDMGGTNVRVAASDNLEDPKIISKIIIKNNHNFDEYISKIFEFAKKQGKISAVGTSTNGQLNKAKTQIVGAYKNTPEKKGKPIVDLIKKELNCKVVMENDCVASVMGEVTYGKNRYKDFVYIILGTGIGGAVVKNVEGKLNIAQIDWDTYLEDWEKDCGGKSIQNRFQKPVQDLTEAEWNLVMGDFKKHLLRFINSFKTEHIIFSGGVALHNFERIKNIWTPKMPEFLLTKFGDDAGLYGAFALINFSY